MSDTEFETVSWAMPATRGFAHRQSMTHLRVPGKGRTLCMARVPKNAVIDCEEAGKPCNSCGGKMRRMRGLDSRSTLTITHRMVREATEEFLRNDGVVIKLAPTPSVPFTDFDVMGTEGF